MSEHETDGAVVENHEGKRSRRSFLAKSTAAAGAVSGLLLAAPQPTFARKPASNNNNNNNQEHFHRLPNLFPGENRRIFEEILQDEENHIVQLTKLADNPRPMPTFQNLLAPTPHAFVQMAAMIENGGVGAYIQGLNAISEGGHHDYFLTAAGITAVEAQHTGFLNALLNQPIAPSAAANVNQPGVATPIPPEQIQAAVGPFIVSLNGGPPFTFNVNQVDDANDQMIINFVLVLEFLEVEFYRMNIQRFFHVL